ncbi:Uncharacterised protein [Legionella pneumophila]|nr:Uncharacterised protein [Legionella pneumophila]
MRVISFAGGVSFFCLDFYLLFSAPHAHSFKQIFIDSFMISSLLLLIIGVVYLTFLLNDKQHKGKALIETTELTLFPIINI